MSSQLNEECSNLLALQDGGFMKNCSNYSVDNESGYEDTISDANDTLNDSIEQDCGDTTSTSLINLKSYCGDDSCNIDTGDVGRDSTDTLADDMSLLSLDHLSQMESHTR
jgi:hypothetical protein